MQYIMNNETFTKYVQNVAAQCAPYREIDTYDNALFVKNCTPREAAKMQSAFSCVGLGVIVTPGAEYTFEFV